MAITWRPAVWSDIEPALSIPHTRGQSASIEKGLVACWKLLFQNPFFVSAVLESTLPIQGQQIVGVGLAVLVTSAFADAEIGSPQPDITSRILAGSGSERPVLLTREDVARANAVDGVDVVILHCAWLDEILNSSQRHDVQTLLASSLVDVLAGYRIRRILSEASSEPVARFHRQSVEYLEVADFPESGRSLYLMNRESGTSAPGSMGNVIFRFQEPVLRLRPSDQDLLSAALGGATDSELSTHLSVSCEAVKARWRSIFAHVAEVMPILVRAEGRREVRGLQKRHRILAYVRNNPVELRPYHW